MQPHINNNSATSVSALYQGAGVEEARKVGLTRVSEKALDLGKRASTPHQWSVENSPQTNGERHYNRLINSTTYLGTFTASLAGAYFFKHTKMGVKFLDPHIARLTKYYENSRNINTAEAGKIADRAVTIGALMAGGTVPAIPFKMLEDTRIDRIKAYNETNGTGIDDPELEKLAKERIELIPKQSNASAAFGRLSAMGLTLAFGIFLPLTAGPIERAQKEVAKGLTKRASIGNLFIKTGEKELIKGAESLKGTTQYRITGTDLDKYLVVDSTWSAFTAGVLLGASRLGAAFFGERKGTETATPAPKHLRDKPSALPHTAPLPQIAHATDLGSVIPEHAAHRAVS